MTLDLSVDRAQWQRVASQIRAMRDRAADVSPAWNALIDWFAEQNTKQFTSRGARYVTPWPPLSPSTIAEKKRLGYPVAPLVRTTALRTSLTQRPMGVEHITGREMSAGTDVSYAHFHQTGTRRMPRRQLFSAAQIRREAAATTAVANWIISGERRVGGRTALRGGR